MPIKKITIRTTSRMEMLDITASIQATIEGAKVNNGICIIYTPHTTAAITINENADPDVPLDIINALDHAIPQSTVYRHAEGNSPAHVKSSLVGTSEIVLIENGKLILGTWQALFFCEFDGPRSRQVFVKIMADQ